MRSLVPFLAAIWFLTSISFGQSLNHDRFETLPRDHFHSSIAYVSSFDTSDDDDGDGDQDLLGVPHWVSYQLNAGRPSGPNLRPRFWQPVPGLPSGTVSPTDDSYRNSGFSRGHMCRRLHAHFSGPQANFESFNLANACPQIASFNEGHWLALEDMTTIWANNYGKVWITCGPLFDGDSIGFSDPGFDLHQVCTIGDPGEVKVTVPRAFFKIVARESSDVKRPEVLAFIYRHDSSLNSSSLEDDHTGFLVSVDEIEARSGLDFFTALPDAEEDLVEANAASAIWPLQVAPSLIAASKAPEVRDDSGTVATGALGVSRTPARATESRTAGSPWRIVPTDRGVFLINSDSGQSFVYDGQSRWTPLDASESAGSPAIGSPLRAVPAEKAPDFGRFEGRVVAAWDDDGRNMTVLEDFHYIDRNGTRWTAPANSVVNGASIPSVFWSAIGGPFTGKYRNASVVHDVYCETRHRPWKDVHRMFYEACRCGGVGTTKAKLMYYAVYHFGPRWNQLGISSSPTPRKTDRAQAQLDAVEAYIEWRDPSLEELESLEPLLPEEE